MSDSQDILQAVRHFATEKPQWLPVLQAACIMAGQAEPYGGQFAGTWVLSKLEEVTGQTIWVPGLRILQAYGLVHRVGSARGGRRAYYTMPDRVVVEQALADIGHPVPATMMQKPGETT